MVVGSLSAANDLMRAGISTASCAIILSSSSASVSVNLEGGAGGGGGLNASGESAMVSEVRACWAGMMGYGGYYTEKHYILTTYFVWCGRDIRSELFALCSSLLEQKNRILFFIFTILPLHSFFFPGPGWKRHILLPHTGAGPYLRVHTPLLLRGGGAEARAEHAGAKQQAHVQGEGDGERPNYIFTHTHTYRTPCRHVIFSEISASHSPFLPLC